MSITSNDIALVLAKNKHVRLRINLLDDNYQTVTNLTGYVKSCSYTMSAESDIRRTCTLTMYIPNKASMDTDFESTWIKRMVELECGIYDSHNSDYVWYSLGRMLMVDAQDKISATDQELSISLVDLMATLTESRGSQMGTDLSIPAGSNVRNSIAAIVALFSPFKQYSIPAFADTIPYDITASIGDYPYSALKKILDLFPYYEMFYDANGKFTVREIPTSVDDEVSIGTSITDSLLISESRSTNFSDVKNTTEIWGASLDAVYTAVDCETVGSCYNLTIEDTFSTLVAGETYSFMPDTDSVVGQTIKIQDTQEHQIYVLSGENTYNGIAAGAMKANVPYVVKYSDSKFILQGELEIHAIVQEIDQEPSSDVKAGYKEDNACRDVEWVVNANSPFACTINGIGKIDREIRQVLTGGEYTSIYTTELALERARYENWKATRLQDAVQLEMLLVPWIDVNQKIQYTSPRSGSVQTVIVQSVDMNFENWTMTVKATKFYEYYPWGGATT